MKHTREQLLAAIERAAEWARDLRAKGRAADAATMDALADCASCAAGRFGTCEPLVREDDADAARVRENFFRGCEPAADEAQPAECCPWVREGVCKSCGWRARQWTFGGRRFQCYTQWSIALMEGRI